MTLDAPAVRDRITGIAAACKALHAGPRFANDFSIFRKYDAFTALCRDHALPAPAGFFDWAGTVHAIEETLAKRHITDVPCHNDLLPENFIEAHGRVRIVDYQLSGNNDPASNWATSPPRPLSTPTTSNGSREPISAPTTRR